MPRKHTRTNRHDESDESGDERRRAFWSGTLSFGLVSIPVELVPANRQGGAPLRMVSEDGTPLQRKYFCPEHDAEVPPEELVHGYELDSGEVVALTDEELEAADPKKSREIDLERFVKRSEIDPLYFERGYFLAPGAGSGKAYRLLAKVMDETDRAGIATFVMREREYIIAIFAEKGLLRAQTLRFQDEVRSFADVGLPKTARPQDKLVARFETAIRALEAPRLPTAELDDEFAEALRELARRKAKSRKNVVHVSNQVAKAEARPDAQIIDLMAALKQSLKEGAAPTRGTKATHARRRERAHTAKRKSV